jgi:hypothetical protein
VFSAVCRHEMQLEPEVVLHAAFAPLAVEQLGLEQLDDVEPDEATLVAWLEMLARKWAERVGG